MDCPKCKAVVENGAAFCTNCGYDFSSDNIIETLDKSAENKKAEKKVKAVKEKKSLFKKKEKKPVN